jgi:hypothetical protein
MEIVLAFVDLWDIVDKSKKVPPSKADPKVLKEYQRRVKKTMSINVFNLADNQLAYIKRCKGPTEAWKFFCNIHKIKSLCNILFVRSQLVGPREQSERACGSTHVFGGTCVRRRYRHDFACNFAGIV